MMLISSFFRLKSLLEVFFFLILLKLFGVIALPTAALGIDQGGLVFALVSEPVTAEIVVTGMTHTLSIMLFINMRAVYDLRNILLYAPILLLLTDTYHLFLRLCT